MTKHSMHPMHSLSQPQPAALGRRQLLLAGVAGALFAAAPRTASSAANAPSAEQLARHVLGRLAWGPRPGDLARVQTMGWRAYVEEQLAPESLPQPALDARLAALHPMSLREQVQAYREAAQEARSDDKKAKRDFNHEATQQAVQTWLLPALDSPRQLHAVMTDFWFNHFNVYINKNLCRVLVGDYIRSAIAPHAMGRFRTLLGATARHPAMLVYLDNWLSSGFNSAVDMPRRRANPNKGRAKGLNENYARELMELHTLGVDGGYTQADVTELARVFTGWTLDGKGGRRTERSGSESLFLFDEQRHDGGPKTWLGKGVPGRGQAQGEWALDVLASHPNTAKRIAFKLVQHFVADEPDADAVQAVAATFMQTDGDIRGCLRTLFLHPSFTAPAALGAKFKSPQRFVISMLRAADVPFTTDWIEPLVAGLRTLGQAPLAWPTPDGHKPIRSAWLDPEALARRATLATRFAQLARLGPQAVPQLLGTLGDAISPRTRAALANEPPRVQAGLLLASPDFQDT